MFAKNTNDEYVLLCLKELNCLEELFKLDPKIVADFQTGLVTASYLSKDETPSIIEVTPDTKYYDVIDKIEEKHNGIVYHVIDSDLQEKPLYLVMMRDSNKMTGYQTKGKREFIFDLIDEDTLWGEKEKASLEGYKGIVYCHELFPKLKKQNWDIYDFSYLDIMGKYSRPGTAEMFIKMVNNEA